ncbi:MAG TPA: hypothetical protein VLM38_02320 [Blastocatellia bacterium]|nr:hypothetical protein [Blastocatellia bacterium]
METNDAMNLDAGIYVNLFELEFDDCSVDLMYTSRDKFPTLRELRDQLVDANVKAQVYAVSEDAAEVRVNKIYGYGLEQHRLEALGFELTAVRVSRQSVH